MESEDAPDEESDELSGFDGSSSKEPSDEKISETVSVFLSSSLLGVFSEDCEFAADVSPSAVKTLFEALLVSELITLCDELLSSETVLFSAFLPQPARAAAEKTNKNNRINNFFIAF